MKWIHCALVGLCSLLIGCTSMSEMGYPLLPEDSRVETLSNPKKIMYILPSELSVDDIQFASYNTKVDSATYQSVGWYINGNKLRVEQRIHNGLAGSGRIYSIDVLTEQPNKVVFTPKQVSIYQEGVFFPYPVPQFDIDSFLTTTFYDYQFEVNSNFQPDSIEGNFIRMLERSTKAHYKYKLDLDSALVLINAKFYPYRDGTKVVINAKVQTQSSDNSLIVIEDIYKEINKKITSIVDA